MDVGRRYESPARVAAVASLSAVPWGSPWGAPGATGEICVWEAREAISSGDVETGGREVGRKGVSDVAIRVPCVSYRTETVGCYEATVVDRFRQTFRGIARAARATQLCGEVGDGRQTAVIRTNGRPWVWCVGGN